MRNTAFFILLTIIVIPSLSFAQEPLEALQQGIDKGISVLEDPQFEGTSRKQEQQQVLWDIMLQVFDFKEFSRRVLGSHWKKFNRQQKDEFVKVFAEFLGKFYMGRLQNRYNGHRLNYLGQQIISKSRALVEIEVIWGNLKIPVEVRMTNRSGLWKVYDLSALGINAVSNYRAQFKWLLRNESPAQVIEKLKERIRKIEKDT